MAMHHEHKHAGSGPERVEVLGGGHRGRRHGTRSDLQRMLWGRVPHVAPHEVCFHACG